ncbi:MAG: hypothetical protein POG74_09770 [Acidocella sp.]|nr:hypothetical protein [Acidocella sp.]
MMAEANRFKLQALVTAEERLAVCNATELLARGLTMVAKVPWTLEYAFPSAIARLDQSPGSSIVITSLIEEVERIDDEAWPDSEARLRLKYQTLCNDPGRSVYICTLLRHVPSDLSSAPARMTRIRRLNLLALNLSRELGVLVADVDRDLADIGARNLQTDYRLQGPYAAQAAGKSLAMTMLLVGLDDLVPFEMQEAARHLVKTFKPPQLPVSKHKPDIIGNFGYRVTAGGFSQIVMK